MEDFLRHFESAGNTQLVAYFYASWSWPCKMITPKLDALEEIYDITLYKIVILKNKKARRRI